MRMLMEVRLHHAPFNAAAKDGTASKKIRRIMEELKPEAAYFIEVDGVRTGIFIVDLADPSGIPALSEPWFLTFGADVHLHPTMTPEDLQKSDLDALGKKWG